jgi:DNA-binding CsgD family transcriptional regulator
VLYPRAGLVSPVEDRDQALSFMERLIDFLKDLSSNHDQLVPNHRLVKRASVLDILKLLPKTNCKACGHGTCMAFAASLSLKEALPEQCPYLGSPVAEQALYPVYDQEGNLNSTVRIDIDTTRTHSKDRADSRPQKTPSQEPSSVPMPLSPRELEVLRILARGYSNKEISRLLEISPHTVKSHVIHIFNKLGVNDRTQAAVWAARRNLL